MTLSLLPKKNTGINGINFKRDCFDKIPGAPLTYFNDGGGPKDFFGSDILAKRDFFGSMKDAGIFLGRENNRGIFWGYCIFHQLKSKIT